MAEATQRKQEGTPEITARRCRSGLGVLLAGVLAASLTGAADLPLGCPIVFTQIPVDHGGSATAAAKGFAANGEKPSMVYDA